MKVISIKVKIYLLKDISHVDALSNVAAFVDKALCKNPKWALMHKKNEYKGYTFSSLAPIEKSGIYSKDSLRTFTLRTIDAELAKYLAEELPHTEIIQMKGLKSDVWIIPQKPIEKLYNLTPTVIKCEEGPGYWKGTLPFHQFQNRIKINLVKKYNFFHNAKLDENFELWNGFEITNQKPIAIPFKGIRLLGDKLEIRIADNQIAQDLAYMALATSLGENNARGCGFCNYHILKGV